MNRQGRNQVKVQHSGGMKLRRGRKADYRCSGSWRDGYWVRAFTVSVLLSGCVADASTDAVSGPRHADGPGIAERGHEPERVRCGRVLAGEDAGVGPRGPPDCVDLVWLCGFRFISRPGCSR